MRAATPAPATRRRVLRPAPSPAKAKHTLRAARQARTRPARIPAPRASGKRTKEASPRGQPAEPSNRRPAAAPAQPADAVRVVPASAGDHLSIYQLLLAVFHAPSRDGFHATLDDPFYEPRDRLLVKRGQRIVSHLHLTQRVMCLGPLQLPVAGLTWLATLPEFRGLGYANRLLAEAERTMAAGGAVLGLVSTAEPRFFKRAGWAVCGRHSQARAAARHVLAQLSARGMPAAALPCSIRPWRQVELPALMRLYAECSAAVAGLYERSEPYWRWLMSHKPFDQVLVLLDGPEQTELESAHSPVAGYMVTRDEQILELMADPRQPTAAEQLLARACGEAIERNGHWVTLHAPPGEPLFDLFHLAGGNVVQQEALGGHVWMFKLVDPVGFLRTLCPELHNRAEMAGLSRPCELGLLIDGRRYRLVISRRSVRLERDKLGRSYLRLSLAEYTRLVLGHLDVRAAVAAARLQASTRLAVETAARLFPRLPFWRPPLDDLVA